MIKVIPSISIHTKAGLFLPGSEVALPDGEAQALLDQNLAIPAPIVKAARPAKLEGGGDKLGGSGE
jgi:hypothetical protein